MKFVIVFTLFALAAARPNRPELPRPPTEDKLEIIREKLDRLKELLNRPRPPIHIGAEPVDTYEPIHVGPAIIDFDPIHPQAIIDSDLLITILRSLIEIIINNRPQLIHVGAEPIDGPVSAVRPPPDTLAALKQWIRDRLNKIWPDSIPRPPRPPTDSLQSVKDWIRDALNRIWPDGVPRPPKPPVGSLEAFKDWILLLIQNLENPITIEPVIVEHLEPESPAATPVSSPLVQIIVNVEGSESGSVTSPVVVEGLDHPSPVHVVEAA